MLCGQVLDTDGHAAAHPQLEAGNTRAAISSNRAGNSDLITYADNALKHANAVNVSLLSFPSYVDLAWVRVRVRVRVRG
jgi:hypothetical protein